MTGCLGAILPTDMMRRRRRRLLLLLAGGYGNGGGRVRPLLLLLLQRSPNYRSAPERPKRRPVLVLGEERDPDHPRHGCASTGRTAAAAQE